MQVQMNAAHEYLATTRLTPDHFDNFCHKLSFQTMMRLAAHGVDAHILWMRHVVDDERITPSTISRRWRYHAAVEIDGMIHDAWFPEVLPRGEYLQRMFPGQLVKCFTGRWDMERLTKQAVSPKYAPDCCTCESCRSGFITD